MVDEFLFFGTYNCLKRKCLERKCRERKCLERKCLERKCLERKCLERKYRFCGESNCLGRVDKSRVHLGFMYGGQQQILEKCVK